MSSIRNGTFAIRSEQDVVLGRQAVRKLAQECGLRLVDQTKLVTAVSELARNAVIYGGGGDMDWAIVEEGARKGVQVVFRDNGPGIADIKQAMTDGWTSGTGLGLGLAGAKRLVDQFDIQSAPGQGTRVTITKWN
ncbi:anti-sigma regulatory factor [Dyella japonica]|uniref:Serine/threonine-protein kinase RsbT n=1 Tax=Dyella japonica TaxID=231455 RepID=A0ABV2JNT1_9GAMM